MPSPETILRLAGSIANEWRALAIAWHAVLATLTCPSTRNASDATHGGAIRASV
jgi:hypothetical protein